MTDELSDHIADTSKKVFSADRIVGHIQTRFGLTLACTPDLWDETTDPEKFSDEQLDEMQNIVDEALTQLEPYFEREESK